MSNFRKIVRHYKPQYGGMSYVDETPSVYVDGVQHYHSERISMQEKFTRESEMPVTNFTLEAQLQSGVPLQDMNPVIFKGDFQSAGNYLAGLADDEPPVDPVEE